MESPSSPVLFRAAAAYSPRIPQVERFSPRIAAGGDAKYVAEGGDCARPESWFGISAEKLQQLEAAILGDKGDRMPNTNAGQSTEEVLTRHWRDFRAGDIESIMSDYAPDAVLVSAMGTLKGHAQIRAAFESIFVHLFPAGTSTLKLEKQSFEAELGFIIWSGTAPNYDVPFATDTFWVRDGKISVQTFAAQMIKK
jgi:hypothetical protein